MSKPIRILFDATALTRQRTGIGFYTEHVIRALAENHAGELELVGYYLLPAGVPPAIPGVTYNPIRWFTRHLLSATRIIGFQPPLSLLIPGWKNFDVVLYPNFVSLPTPPKLPSVVVIYDLCFIDHPEFVDNLNARYLQRYVPPSLRHAAKIVADSEFTKDRIAEVFKTRPANIAVAYPGLAVGQAAKSTKQLKLKPIVYVGTLEPRKNIENLLAGYAKLPENLQQKHPLILAGGRGWKDEKIMQTFEQLKSKGLPVAYRGYISDSEKAELYHSAAAVAVLSHYEGFGMQILEAMSYEAPLLLSNIPAFLEVAGNAAYYCDKDSPADISRGLVEVLERFDEKKKTDYQKILTKFSWDNAAEVYMDVFRELTEKKS